MEINTKTLLVLAILFGIVISPTVTLILKQYSIATPWDEDHDTYICPYCGEYFDSQEALNDHIRNVHGAEPEDLVGVKRHIDWQIIDDYAGGGVGTAYIYVYDTELHKFEGDGSAYKTASDGTLESGMDYQSGQHLKVYVVKSNAKAWYDIVVPKMQSQDAEALTTNPVPLRFFTEIGSTTAPTFTLMAGGSAISDGGSYNATASGDQKTFTFTITCEDDNTGYMNSYDPLNDINWYCAVYIKQFQAGYETVSLTGFDDVWEKGDALYYAKVCTPNGESGITRYKVGNNYIWTGQWSFSFTGDFTGCGVDTVDWDINIYIYTDPAYYEAKASFGPDSVQLGSTFDVDIYGA